MVIKRGERGLNMLEPRVVGVHDEALGGRVDLPALGAVPVHISAQRRLKCEHLYVLEVLRDVADAEAVVDADLLVYLDLPAVHALAVDE